MVTLRYWSGGKKQNLLSILVLLCIVDNGERWIFAIIILRFERNFGNIDSSLGSKWWDD
jgi:hypothetical protein